MGQGRLSSMAILNIERDFKIDMNKIVKEFITETDSRKLIF